jgi:hypothetical protein
MGEASQRTAEQHAVKTGKRTLDLGFKLSDKLFHGVSSWCMVIWNINQGTSSETPFEFAACRFAGRPILAAPH